MDHFARSHSVDSEERDTSLCSGSLSVLPKDQITEYSWNKIYLKRPTVSLPGDYLTLLWVSRNEEPCDELYRAENNVPHDQKFKEKIRAALKLLMFREKRVLVQFWSPLDVGKHQLLTTIDQPFGLGVIDAGLRSYRRNSERNVFLVDKDHAEEDISPPARVFRRGLPEWTSDIQNYLPKDFLQQECAIRCNLHGYLALPVFDSNTNLCVGVIELLMSSKTTDYAFEVQQVHKALKKQNLKSPQVFDFATPNVFYQVSNEQRQIDELDILSGILRSVCDSHSLPLAQAWAVSPSTSFVSHDNILDKTCSSFDTKCIGKVCMSTNGLPFHVRDMGMWPFREACKEHHLDKSRSFVGKALLARGSTYCQDVTELTEEEYPFVHAAHNYKIASCFAIFLHSLSGNDEYVLEFFLPSYMKDGSYVPYLVQTLKQKVEDASGFELGETSSPTEVTGPPRDASFMSFSIKPQYPQISAVTTRQKMSDTTTNAGLKSNTLKRGRKRKIDSLRMEAVQQHVGKPMKQAAESLDVGMSTLRLFCRENGIMSWPKASQSTKSSHATDLKMSQVVSQQSSQRSSSGWFARRQVVLFVIRVKRLSSLGRHSYLPSKSDSIYQEAQVTVKAIFKGDMIKFRFPISSGLSELKNEVARRLNLKGKKLSIKYEDRENDLILITCDDDLHTLPEFLASNTTVKLLVACE